MTMRAPVKGLLIRAAIGAAAAVAIAIAVKLYLDAHGGAVVVGVGAHPIHFLAPGWFYLLALVPFFFVVRTQSLTDISIAQQYLSTGVRSLLVAGLAVALARPVHIAHDDKVATVVLVDVSQSITDGQLAAARKYVHALRAAKPAGDRLYLITFAARPRLVTPARGEAITRHKGGDLGTNIEAAVQLGYGVFPEGYLPRMIILSDGNQTRGDLLGEAYRAKELGVRISWKTFAAVRPPETRIAALDLPDEIKVGAPFDVVAKVWTNRAGKATLALDQDEFPNGLEPRKTVDLRPGMNKVAFKSQAKRAGFTTYKVRLVSVAHDTQPANNEMVMSAPVKGRPRVLYVEGGLIHHPHSASYLRRALEAENIDVEVRGPQGIPSTAKALQRYDLVLISDVPAEFVGLAQMRALDSYVRDLGGGLIMAGGQNSFGSGGYEGTRMEKIMPVRFDTEKIRNTPEIAVMLLIDRSGSMQGQKLEAAKASARATTQVLDPSDLVGVVAFDNQPTTVVRIQRASNRMRISTDIARLRAGGGTNIFPALQEAYETLQTVNAKVKDVILLTDGQAPYDGIADLCHRMHEAGITVSAVGIGDADRNLLSLIADNGQGRLYMTDNLASLPRIFMKETTEAKKSVLVEDTVKVRVAKRVEMIEGTDVEDAPPLLGYVSTKPKPTSEVILVSGSGEPLLARWRYGAGTSVAWTSDVKNRWSVNWLRWKGYPKFWAQIVRTTMRRKVYNSYDLAASVTGGRAHVVVDAIANGKFVNGLDTTLQVIDPRDSKPKREIPMKQTAAGRYTADFRFHRYGTYILKAIHRRGGRIVAESVGSVALPYPEEYRYTAMDEAPMRHAAMVTGGVNQIRPQAAFRPLGESIAYTHDLWPWVLLFVACGFVLDLYLRRVRIFGYRTIKF